MKLIIKESCIGPKGAHLERGTTVEISEERDYIALIGHGKAYSATSEKGKDFSEVIDGEKQAKEAAKLAGKSK